MNGSTSSWRLCLEERQRRVAPGRNIELDQQLQSSAVGQLYAVNPTVERPNVLAIVKGDDGAGFTDLIQVLTATPTERVAK